MFKLEAMLAAALLMLRSADSPTPPFAFSDPQSLTSDPQLSRSQKGSAVIEQPLSCRSEQQPMLASTLAKGWDLEGLRTE